MALMSYLLRDRLGTYYFRRVIPKDLQPFMPAPWTGKANWKISLKTKVPAIAKQAAFRVGRDCMADFEAAERAKRGERMPSLARHSSLPRDEEIMADELTRLLAEDDAERSEGDARRQHQTAEERGQWPDLAPIALDGRWMEEDHHHVHGQELEAEHTAYAKALSRSDFRSVRFELGAYLKRKNIPIDPTSEDYRRAGLAVLMAHVKAGEMKLARQRGEIVVAPAPSAGRGPKLSEAFDAWKTGSGARGSKEPGERTLLEADHAVRRLTEWHGDIRLGDLTREMAREFRDALAKVPTRLPGDLRVLPLRALLKRDLKAYPSVHAATINKSLNILSAIVNHAEAAGKLDAVSAFRNPFGRGTKLVVDARTEDARQPFTADDTIRIFGTGVYRNGERPAGGGGEAAFWLPLLALLSGARQGELAQLRIADLAYDTEAGVWYLDIGTAGGRSIKTASSRRKVPLHPALKGIGLLRYRQSLMDSGVGLEASLWPMVEADAQGRQNGPWSKWFNRYLRDKAGVEDRTKVFHSFRHTFKRLARDAKVTEEMHDALTGHAGGGVGRGYGAGFSLKTLAEEMARIEVPETVRDLKWY